MGPSLLTAGSSHLSLWSTDEGGWGRPGVGMSCPGRKFKLGPLPQHLGTLEVATEGDQAG